MHGRRQREPQPAAPLRRSHGLTRPASDRSRGIPAAVYAGCAGALAYGGLKLVWSFGSTAGIEGVPPWQDGSGWWTHADGFARVLAFEGTVVLSALAALVMLALVQPWGKRLPQRPLVALAGLGGAAVGTAWLAGGVLMTVRIAEGRGARPAGPGETTAWAFWLISASFAALAVGLGAASVEGRRRLAAGRLRDRDDGRGEDSGAARPSVREGRAHECGSRIDDPAR